MVSEGERVSKCQTQEEIQGGGGGQPFYATAGGKNIDGLKKALEQGRDFVKQGS